MRLDWPPPRDLAASVLICILALIIVFLSPQQISNYSAPLALLLVVLLPGHLLAFCLYPARGDLDARRRALLSLGSSAAVAGLVGLVLTLTPRGLQPATLATMLSLLSLFLAAVAYLRWSALPRRKRLGLRSRRSLRNTSALPVPAKTTRHLLVLALGLGAILAIATSGFDISLLRSPTLEMGFTELNVSQKALPAQSDSLPAEATGTAMVRIINHEHRLVNYTLQLVHNNTTLFERDVRLGDNQSWQEPVGYRLGGPAGSKRLDFLLYKEGDALSPYREERLLINVSENVSSEPDDLSEINASSEKAAAMMEQNRRVVVLGVGDGGSHGGSGSSSSSGSKPSYQAAPSSKKDQDQEPVREDPVIEDQANEGPVDEGSRQMESEELPTDSPEAGKGEILGDLQSKVSPEHDADSPQAGANLPPGPDANSRESRMLSSQPEAAGKTPLPEEQILAAAGPQKTDAAAEETPAAPSGDKGISAASDKAQEAGTADSTPKTDAEAGSSQASEEPAVSSGGQTDASGTAREAAGSDKDKSVTSSSAGIGQEINSWVATRATASSGKSQRAYESQNIRYVRDDKGERAVLGRSATNVGAPAESRSREPRRLG